MTQTRDWLMRALQPAAGFNANDPIEAVYLNVSVDGDGKTLRRQIATSSISTRAPSRRSRRSGRSRCTI